MRPALGWLAALVGGALVLVGAPGTGALDPKPPRPDAEMLLDLDLLRDADLARERSLLTRLRILERLRLLESLPALESALSTPRPDPATEVR